MPDEWLTVLSLFVLKKFLVFCPWCETEKTGTPFSPEFPEWHENCLDEFKTTLIAIARNYRSFRL